MILNSGYPPDIRIEKEVETLLPAHRVFLLCTKRSGEAGTDTIEGLRVTRVFSAIERRAASYQLVTTCHSKGWKKEIDHFIQDNRLDVLHVHDLPLAGTALGAARSYRIPIVLDLHEDYPAMLSEIQRLPRSRIPSVGVLGLRLASIPKWREYEQRIARKMDAVIAVVEEAATRIRALGVEAKKVHLVQNYGPLRHISMRDATDAQTVTAVYIGGFDQARDLRTVIDAARLLRDRNCDHLRILLVGGSRREIGVLEKYASKTSLSVGMVSFREWMDRQDAEKFVDDAQIGLVPHVKSAHTDSTIPHKLFQYMARGLPVIASNCAPLERIVGGSGCGLVYESGNAGSLAMCVEELYRDPNKRERMGNAGSRAVQMTYNWSTAAVNLLDLYDQLK